MINLSRHILSNGLTVVHSKNAVTGMVAVNLLYKVGSRDEDCQHTGLAHFVEHLMFGGSLHAKNFDQIIQEAGGESNAWTNADITNFYELLPVQNIETALWLEADRMENLLLSDRTIEVQRSVVQEEFKQRCLNTPYGDSWHLLRDLCYEKHPYRWPVIGKCLSDIENVSADTIRTFYSDFYVPNNAILSIVGNIDADIVFGMAEKCFGGIPTGLKTKPILKQEERQTKAKSLVVERNMPHKMLLKAYHMCERCHSDYYVCDLISDVLSNGRSSRMYRNIYAPGKLVASIDASISGDTDPGLFLIKAQLLPGVDYSEVEEAIDREISMLIKSGVDFDELNKCYNKYEANHMFLNLNNDDLASNLGYYEMLGDASLINGEIERYRLVSSGDVSKVASEIFDKGNSTTLYYS